MNKDALKKIENENRKPDGNRWKCPYCTQSEVKTREKEPTLKDLMDRIIKMDNKMDELNRKYDEQVLLNKKLSDEIINLKQQVGVLKREKNYNDQKLLESNIIVSGIPELEKKEVTNVVIKLAKKLRVKLSDEDFTCHQIGKVSQDGKQLIKVKLHNLAHVYNIMAAKKIEKVKAKDLDFDVDSTIYISSDLTKYNQEILRQAKIFKKENNYEFVWYKEGNIYLRQTQFSKRVHIKSLEDLNNLKN
ncbi:hypothetical protein WA026_001266 [Henosepilachna vigintioctopunctata]|uniref:FP protein C-terminal domain-containing protein n=1 Tax=Henosepilachna vigintioctopunctata TaxID=420089 RepID=A0AAW1UHD9_9CUCU